MMLHYSSESMKIDVSFESLMYIGVFAKSLMYIDVFAESLMNIDGKFHNNAVFIDIHQ